MYYMHLVGKSGDTHHSSTPFQSKHYTNNAHDKPCFYVFAMDRWFFLLLLAGFCIAHMRIDIPATHCHWGFHGCNFPYFLEMKLQLLSELWDTL